MDWSGEGVAVSRRSWIHVGDQTNHSDTKPVDLLPALSSEEVDEVEETDPTIFR